MFFDEPDWMSSDKENIPLTESVTPPSLKNLSLEEEANDNDNEATSWEASVARNLRQLPGKVPIVQNKLAHLKT